MRSHNICLRENFLPRPVQGGGGGGGGAENAQERAYTIKVGKKAERT